MTVSQSVHEESTEGEKQMNLLVLGSVQHVAMAAFDTLILNFSPHIYMAGIWPWKTVVFFVNREDTSEHLGTLRKQQ